MAELNKSMDESEDEELNERDNEEFTQVLSKTTRKVHKMTDLLVNVKLGIGMLNDDVWAEGLLIFYEIFRFLELSLFRLKTKLEPFRRFSEIIEGIERTPAFEEDLKTYYGNDFLTNYTMRPQVKEYLKHLEFLEKREPLRLIAYIYHLYLGLLSGGQILHKKREIKARIVTFGGLLKSDKSSFENNVQKIRKSDSVTTFKNDGRTIGDMKREIKFTMNDIASDLSRDEKNSLIDESTLVFKNNLKIIKTISGTGKRGVIALLTSQVFLFFIAMIVVLVAYLFMM